MTGIDHDIRWWREKVSQRAGILGEDLDELEDHLRILIDQRIAAGDSAAEAFGYSTEQLRDVLGAEASWIAAPSVPPLPEPWSPSTARRPNGGEILWSLIQDLRFAIRTLAKKPGYTAIVVLVLAIGIGINSSVFSLIYSLLWRPTNLDNPKEIVVFASTNAEGRTADGLSYLDFLEYEKEMSKIGGLALHFPLAVQLRTDIQASSRSAQEGPARRVWGNITSANYFETLGVRPLLGRAFDSTAGNEAEQPTVVLGYPLWQSRFSSDRDIVGREVLINGQAFTVIGVAPQGFRGAHALISAELWFPISTAEILAPRSKEMLDDRKQRNIWAVGRLAPPTSLEQAKERLQNVADSLAAEFPEANKGIGIAVFPESHSRMGTSSGPVMKLASTVMLASVALVLMIACVNVANLVLVRAAGRRQEITVRLALGASRARVVRQLLTESLVLASLGGLGGLVMAAVSMRLLANFLTTSSSTSGFPIFFDPAIEPSVILYALLLTASTAVLFGLVPALQASRASFGSTLRSEGRALSTGSAGGRLGRGMVAAEVAACLVLLVTASLFARSLQNVVKVDVGFDPADRTVTSFDLGLHSNDEDRQLRFYRDLRERVAALPGVESATWAMPIPLDTFASNTFIYVDGYDQGSDAGTEPLQALYSNVDAHYFDTMGTPILRGRPIEATDLKGRLAVAVINQAMAERYWPNRSALGERFRLESPDGPEVQVVGIAADGKYRQVTETKVPYIFLPYEQGLGAMISASLVVHSTQSPQSLAEQVRRQSELVDPSVMQLDVRSLNDHLRGSAFLPATIAAALVSVFGLLGLALAVVGLYGVLSYSVSQQTNEIGLRIAMGATRRDILSMVLGSGMRLTAVGVALGLLVSVAAGRVIVGLLHNVSAIDPVTFMGIPPLLALVALLACWIPAHRATRIDPTSALRNE